MKKITIGILSAAFILGAGSYTFAQANGEGKGLDNFGQMKSHMEEKHPDLSTKELKEMFDKHHGKGGMMEDSSSCENMDSMMN